MNRKTSRVRAAGRVAAVLIVAAASHGCSRVRTGATDNAPAADTRPTIVVARAARARLVRTVEVPATVEAFERTDLYAKVAGYVKEVRVDLGDRVQAGDVLATIDEPEVERARSAAQAPRTARAAELDAATATLEQQKIARELAQRQAERYGAVLKLERAAFQRQQDLFDGKAITDQQLDDARNRLELAQSDVAIAETRVRMAQAKLATATATATVGAARVEVAASDVARIETMLEYGRIVAPFSGMITRRLVDRGALVQAATASRTTPLFIVQRIDEVRVFADVRESDVPSVHPGTRAQVRLVGSSGRLFDHPVDRIANALEADTRRMRAEIDLENKDGALLPGMYAQVTLVLGERENALTVPMTAVLANGSERCVLAVKDERIIRIAVKIGLNNNARVEVTEGLVEGTPIVIKPGSLSAGLDVKTTEQK